MYERIGKAKKSAARYDLEWTKAKPLKPSRKWKDIARHDLDRPITARPTDALATNITARFDLGRSEVAMLSLSSNVLHLCMDTLVRDTAKKSIARLVLARLPQARSKSKIMVRSNSRWITKDYG